MTEFEYVVKDPVGIHARPAGLLVRLASKFDADIEIIKDGRAADAKRIFSVMGLGVQCGDTIHVRISGDDAQRAADALLRFIQEHF